MRKLYILILLLVIGVASEAQPQYWNRLPTAGANAFPFGINAATGKRVQWAIAAGEFNQPSPAPASNITSIWFRPNTANNTTFTTLTIKMATVSTSTFIPGIGQWYSGPMTTVLSQNTNITTTAALQWFEIPLTTVYPYDPTMNLIIEVYQCGYTGAGFAINHDVIDVAPNYRRQYSDASSVCGATVLATGGQFNVPAIGINLGTIVSCPAPTAQPTNLILTAVSQVQINGSFTPPASPPTNYLVVRYPFGSVPTNPVNGTNYVVGGTLGTGTVVSVSNATSFSATGLSPATQYTFYVYSYNTGACNTTYRTTAPLTGSQTTLSCAGPPTITCPASMTVNNTPGLCGANVSYPPATATGSPTPTITYSAASGSFFPKGTTTVTATATNVCGTASCTFTITVIDNQPPTITCPANITANASPGLCSAVVTYTLPTVTDNCCLPGVVTLTQTASQTPVAGSISCNAGGFHTLNRYFRAYDLSAMCLGGPLTINSVQFGIELADANGTGTTQPVTVNVYTSATAFPTGFPGSLTLIGTSGVVQVPDQTLTTMTVPITVPPTVPANARLVIELVTPDGRAPANNRFFIGSNSSVETGPSYIMAPDCAINTPTTTTAIGFPNMHIILNVNGVTTGPNPLSQIAGLASGSVFPVGVTTNTFRATDAAGNTATCSFTVTVIDNQAPAVTCPVNIVANTNPGVCTATVATPNPTTSDNCAVTTVTWVMTGATTGSSPATGINYVGTRAFNLNGTTGTGVTTITYTVKDAAGNTVTCSYTVTVNDLVIPVIGGQPTNQFVCVGSNGAFTVTVTANGGPISYQWQTWNGSAWVNIAGATAATLPLSAVAFTQNTTDYRVIVTGLCSQVISNFATLYVNQLPTISLLASGPIALLPGQSLSLTAIVSPGGGTFVWRRNGVVVAGATGATLTGLTVDDIGSYTATYTDPNGCVATSAAMVISGQPSDKIWVYPNPNMGIFQVRFYNAVNENVNVNIYDFKGAKVYNKAVTTSLSYTQIDVDISNVPAGTYLIEVINSAGKSIGARKVSVHIPQ